MTTALLIAFALGLLAYQLWLPVPGRDARFATRSAAKPLVLQGPSSGRIGLGRWATGSWRGTRHRLAAPAGGSVLVVGPTQSGKSSSLVIPALLAWEGPVLAASVKDDLVLATAAWRRRLGEVGVLDPLGAQPAMACRFDPVALAGSWPKARAAAGALCEPLAESGGSDAASPLWTTCKSAERGGVRGFGFGCFGTPGPAKIIVHHASHPRHRTRPLRPGASRCATAEPQDRPWPTNRRPRPRPASRRASRPTSVRS